MNELIKIAEQYGTARQNLVVGDKVLVEASNSNIGPYLILSEIVAITGDHSPGVKERILSSGADLFFTKPLEIVEFREKCFQLLQS